MDKSDSISIIGFKKKDEDDLKQEKVNNQLIIP